METITLELDARQVERLERAAKELGRSATETVSLILEEALREREFARIEFRDTVLGREAYLRGTRLKIWMVEMVLRDLGDDLSQAAKYFSTPIESIAEARRYADAFREEVDTAIAENDRSPEELKRLYPGLNITVTDVDASDS